MTTMPVALRPSIKLVNQSAKTVRKVALWDGAHQQILATFERNVARPILENGKYYLVVVEQSDGSERKMMLQASEVTRTGPVFLVVCGRAALVDVGDWSIRSWRTLSGCLSVLLAAICGLVGFSSGYNSFFPALGGPNGCSTI